MSREGLIPVKKLVHGVGVKPHYTTYWVKPEEVKAAASQNKDNAVTGFAQSIEKLGGDATVASYMHQSWFDSSKSPGAFAMRQALADAGHVTQEAVQRDLHKRSGYVKGAHNTEYDPDKGTGVASEYVAHKKMEAGHEELADLHLYGLKAPDPTHKALVRAVQEAGNEYSVAFDADLHPAVEAAGKKLAALDKQLQESAARQRAPNLEQRFVMAQSAHAAALAAQSMHEETVTLHRGIGEGQAAGILGASGVDVDSLSSWTENYAVAHRFASSQTFSHSAVGTTGMEPGHSTQTRNKEGAVLTITVPRSAIVASHRVGGSIFASKLAKTLDGQEVVIANSDGHIPMSQLAVTHLNPERAALHSRSVVSNAVVSTAGTAAHVASGKALVASKAAEDLEDTRVYAAEVADAWAKAKSEHAVAADAHGKAAIDIAIPAAQRTAHAEMQAEHLSEANKAAVNHLRHYSIATYKDSVLAVRAYNDAVAAGGSLEAVTLKRNAAITAMEHATKVHTYLTRNDGASSDVRKSAENRIATIRSNQQEFAESDHLWASTPGAKLVAGAKPSPVVTAFKPPAAPPPTPEKAAAASPAPPPPPAKPAPLAVLASKPATPKKSTAELVKAAAPKKAAAAPAKAGKGADRWDSQTLAQLEAVPANKRDVHWLRRRNKLFQETSS